MLMQQNHFYRSSLTSFNVWLNSVARMKLRQRLAHISVSPAGGGFVFLFEWIRATRVSPLITRSTPAKFSAPEELSGSADNANDKFSWIYSH